jgi:deazaflavin-dependent oxidoreductase (nitroreductase family)
MVRSSTHSRISTHYRAPSWFDRKLMNPLIAGATRLGLSAWGSRVLEVRGRKSGEPRRNPVNPLEFEGARYLVAPRGQTQWVRNLRMAGEGHLLLGSRREHFSAIELADADKEEILRAYLRRWKWEVGKFFDGVSADSPSEEMRRIAPEHPVFRISHDRRSGPGARSPGAPVIEDHPPPEP